MLRDEMYSRMTEMAERKQIFGGVMHSVSVEVMRYDPSRAFADGAPTQIDESPVGAGKKSFLAAPAPISLSCDKNRLQFVTTKCRTGFAGEFKILPADRAVLSRAPSTPIGVVFSVSLNPFAPQIARAEVTRFARFTTVEAGGSFEPRRRPNNRFCANETGVLHSRSVSRPRWSKQLQFIRVELSQRGRAAR